MRGRPLFRPLRNPSRSYLAPSPVREGLEILSEAVPLAKRLRLMFLTLALP